MEHLSRHVDQLEHCWLLALALILTIPGGLPAEPPSKLGIDIFKKTGFSDLVTEASPPSPT